MKHVTVHAAKTQLSRLIARALAGEDVVIARGATPVVRLVPIAAPPPKRTPGTLRGRLCVTEAFLAPLPPDELAVWGESDE
jgi:prevent-host-death family protein